MLLKVLVMLNLLVVVLLHRNSPSVQKSRRNIHATICTSMEKGLCHLQHCHFMTPTLLCDIDRGLLFS